MSRTIWQGHALAVLAIVSAGSLYTHAATAASPDKTATVAYGTDGQYKLLVERVTRAQSDRYRTIVAEYDEYIAAHPEEVVARVEKCRFIDQFADLEDFPIDDAGDDARQCNDALRDPSLGNDGRVHLYLLDRMYGKEMLQQAEKLLPEAYAWTQPQRARLYEKLADAHRRKNPVLADNELANAVQLDPLSSRRIQVAESLAKRGAAQEALQLIRDTPPPAWEHLPIDQAAALLIQLGAPEDAMQLLKSHPDSGDSREDRLMLARALAKTGKISSARDEYLHALGADNSKVAPLWATEYFKFELAHGTAKLAEDAYNRVRSSGADSDLFGRYRLALTLRHPGAPWTIGDLRGVARLLALLLVIMLLPVSVVGLVHYRSLAKRLRGFVPEPGNWGLRSLWYALTIVLVVPTLAAFVTAYDAFMALASRFNNPVDLSEGDVASLGEMLIWQTAMMALCTVPLLWRVDRGFFLGRTSIRATIGWTLLALMACFSVAAGFGFVLQGYRHAAALGDLTTQAVQSVRQTYGIWGALLLVSGFVPAIEEVLFRGVILQSLARYLTFRWAVVIQAALFASVHESTQALPYVFLLGLVAGWLVRRCGGLLAPMLFHSINNAVYLAVLSTAMAR